MKFRVVVDVDVSQTMADTIKRGGFTLCQDGSGQQVRVGGNNPAIPKRKTAVMFIEEPQIPLQDLSEDPSSKST
jgi:hypothetical protein